KICPDGSAVGRTGPNCEFAPCPGESGGKEMDNGGASGGSGAAGTADVQYLLAHKWNLISINGREVGENPVYIVFNGNQGTFGGSAGCNYMNGNYALDGNQISFAQTAITLMHCEEYAELESDVIGVIGGGPYAWGISGNTMSFYKGSDLVAVWEGEAG
ncbi:MAG: META domain-containing protein, partial [Candidatus Bilamarchaeaceae archaeon]